MMVKFSSVIQQNNVAPKNMLNRLYFNQNYTKSPWEAVAQSLLELLIFSSNDLLASILQMVLAKQVLKQNVSANICHSIMVSRIFFLWCQEYCQTLLPINSLLTEPNLLKLPVLASIAPYMTFPCSQEVCLHFLMLLGFSIFEH